MFRVILSVPREFRNYALLCQTMDKLLAQIHDHIVIVCGQDACLDNLCEKYAHERHYKLHLFPSDWERWGDAADYIRNEEMGDAADALVAFFDGKCRQVKQMIDIGHRNGLNVRTVKCS